MPNLNQDHLYAQQVHIRTAALQAMDGFDGETISDRMLDAAFRAVEAEQVLQEQARRHDNRVRFWYEPRRRLATFVKRGGDALYEWIWP